MLGGIYIPDARTTIEDISADIIELLDALGIDKFDVIGFSWGTLPELALLARVPERIGRAEMLGARQSCRVATAANRGIDWIDPGGANAYQYFARRNCWLCHIHILQNIGWAVGTVLNCLHGLV